MMYSPRYEAALVVAAREHHGQNRKGTTIPYITHPVHVSLILARYGFSEDVLIAGLLHDVIEDQGYPLRRIAEEFGPHVAEMVGALSEQKWDEEGGRRPWRERKEEALDVLRQANEEVIAIKAADIVHNASTMAADLRREGPAVWGRFNSDPASILWYHRSVAALTRERLGDHPLVEELEAVVDDLAALLAAQSAGES